MDRCEHSELGTAADHLGGCLPHMPPKFIFWAQLEYANPLRTTAGEIIHNC